MNPNTLFLRLEGALQAWGNHESKFLIRRTSEAPTKSGVIGLLCAALGVSRSEAPDVWLPMLRDLKMGVRIDRPGVRWWDYHTVGANLQMQKPDGNTKPGAMLTRREYLADASFLVALYGDPTVITGLEEALQNPKWTLYLGRKCCPPSVPIIKRENNTGDFPDLMTALRSVKLTKRLRFDKHNNIPENVECLLDWTATESEPEAPNDAEVWFDIPESLDPPAHSARFVVRQRLSVGTGREVQIASEPLVSRTLTPPRPRADYTDSQYKKRRKERIDQDHHLCVFCKSYGTTVQHITYRNAGGSEKIEELCTLCRLCHDAVTMIEYGLGMGLDRIDPMDPKWREKIVKKRAEIVKYRSLETRRRRLSAEEVE